MKSVLLSIKPKYCELIASGKKTIEIRKNRPKIDTPFKVYMYCTRDGTNIYGDNKSFVTDCNKYLKNDSIEAFERTSQLNLWNGKVIGEYICDDMSSYRMCMGIPQHLVMEGCVSANSLWQYSNGGYNDLHSWDISDLKIYDEPKELSEFTPYCDYNIDGKCFAVVNSVGCDCTEPDWNPDGTVNIYLCTRRLKHPPQSWCYVDELEE